MQSPIDSLISLVPNKFSVISDYMYKCVWQYEGLDSTDGLCGVWNDNNGDEDFVRKVKVYYQNPKTKDDYTTSVAYINFWDTEFAEVSRKLESLA